MFVGVKKDCMEVVLGGFVGWWALLGIGNGYGLHRGRWILGVDFAGGDQQTYTFAQKVEADQVRKVVEAQVGESSIAYQHDIASGQDNLRITSAFNTADKVTSELQQKFPEAQFKRIGLDKVGATVGREITKTAVVASLLALFGILVYVAFRYEFSFAVGAVVAILHDILMTM